MYHTVAPLAHHQRPDWLEAQLRQLQQQGGMAFCDRSGEVIVISRSAKKPGWWQATWFTSGGPYRDALAPSPRRLLWQVQPWLQVYLQPQAAEARLRRLLLC